MRLILPSMILCPTALFAEVCDKQRPDWDGGSIGAFDEVQALLISPAGGMLILLSVAVIWSRRWWAALIMAAIWLGISAIRPNFDGSGGVNAAAILEGCIGPLWLANLVCAAFGAVLAIYSIKWWRHEP